MTAENTPQVVRDKLEALPAQPGCYVFRGEGGVALYIGKAKSLRSRVRSYFQPSTGDTRAFLPLLHRLVVDLETIVVGSEKEAAILENGLIKELRPRFNVKLRDDKEFLSLRLDARAEWPRLEVVRRPESDGARYFGPYPSASAARRTLHLVNKHFQLRTCSDAEMASRQRPCLQYQIKRCPAPCVYEVDREAYAAQVKLVGLFLRGRHDELSGELEGRMREAARAMRFEEAALLRDQLRAAREVQATQRVVGDPGVDQDALGLHREGDLAEIAMLFVRGGRVSDTATFSLKGVELPDDELIAGFVRQYYDALGDPANALPDEVLLPELPEGADGVAEWLAERRGRKVALVAPQRGKKADLLALAVENAAHAFREKKRASDDVAARLAQVQALLRLPAPPRRIECVDISHLGGEDTVGAVVALLDGQPDKRRYRVFHVQGVSGGDDYAAMFEVLSRRFRRALAASATAASAPVADAPEPLDDGRDGPPDEPHAPPLGASVDEPNDESSHDDVDALAATSGREAPAEVGAPAAPAADDRWSLPDLFVVDGGRGQLNVALRVARDLGLRGLSIVGLAKERETVSGETLVDRVYLPGQKNGIALRPQSAALFLLALARDEAHRFSNRARETLGKRRRLRSVLDDVPGLSPTARKALLASLGSVEAIRGATDERLLAVEGVSARAVKSLRKFWAGG